jgi:CheY-like chemotaxis protein
MGGATGAESKPGAGSTFWFTARMERGHGVLPAATELEDVGAEEELRANHTGARVLLAEDNAINREVALELLHATGLEVETAADGREALKRVQTQRFDLVLMDVQMPEVGGIDATQAIRALPGFAALPIIAMTANAFDDDRRSCLAAGMNDFIAKPVDPENLYRTLLRWLPRRNGSPAVAPVTAPPELAAGPDESALMPVLSQIAGLDAVRGIRMMRGDLNAYARLVLRLVADHGDDCTQLTSQIADGQHEAARLTAHSLKGAAGTLCAVKVQAAAAALEVALREGHAEAELGVLLAALAAEMDALRKAVARLPGSAVKPEGSTLPDHARAGTVLRALELLLMADDTEAEVLFHKNQAVLEATLGTPASALAEPIERFDYPAALATLRNLIDGIRDAGPLP